MRLLHASASHTVDAALQHCNSATTVVRLPLCALDNVLAADCLNDDAATFLIG